MPKRKAIATCQQNDCVMFPNAVAMPAINNDSHLALINSVDKRDQQLEYSYLLSRNKSHSRIVMLIWVNMKCSKSVTL